MASALHLGIILFYIHALIYTGFVSTAIERPSIHNVTVFEGQTTLLKCPMPAYNKENISVYKDHIMVYVSSRPHRYDKALYTVAISPRHELELTIKNTSLGDCARYQCKEVSSQETLTQFNIIIIEVPEVQTDGRHFAGEIITSKCILHYRTPHRCTNDYNKAHCPTLSLLYKNIATDNNSPTCHKEDASYACTIEIKYPHTAGRADDGQVRTCVAATNRTQTETRSKQSKLVVKYPVSDINIYPNETSFKVGDDIICNATGNPLPKISWTDNDVNRRIECQKLHMTEDMKGHNNWTCEAENEPDIEVFQKKAYVAFEVDELATNDETNTSSIAFGLLGGIVALVILIALVVALKKKYFTTTQESVNTHGNNGAPEGGNQDMPLVDIEAAA